MEPSTPAQVAVSAKRRTNLRIVGFAVLVLALLGTPLYSMISDMVRHGVHETTDDKGRKVYDVKLKYLGNFAFSSKTGTIEDVPPQYRSLDGKRVALEGFMAPPTMTATASPSEFEFVYNVQICCFGGPPQVQERVFSFFRAGQEKWFDKTVKLRMTGVLHVEAKFEAGQVVSVYRLDVESLKPI